MKPGDPVIVKWLDACQRSGTDTGGLSAAITHGAVLDVAKGDYGHLRLVTTSWDTG